MNKFSIVIFFVFSTVLCSAQVGPGVQLAPYSQGNLGFQKTDFYTKNFGMANVGLAHYNENSPNLKNPALLTYNKFTILDVNLGLSVDKIDFSGGTVQNTSGSLNSINLVIPMSYKWTSAFSLKPSTHTSYGAESKTIFSNSGDTIYQSDTAFGGIQKVTWSNGINVYKNFNLGFAASYSFGNISKLSQTEVIGVNSLTVNDYISSKYKGFDVELSAANHQIVKWQKADPDFNPKRDTTFTIIENGKKRKISILELKANTALNEFIKDTIVEIEKGKKDRKLRIGLGGTYSSPLNWKREDVTILSNSFISTGDTSTTSISAPSKMAVGISIGNLSRKSNWSLAFDYELETAYTYKVGVLENKIPSSSRMSIGFQITPELESENFFKNTTYSVGAYQAKTPYTYNDEQLEEVGIHFGLSFVDKARRANESFRWREKTKTRYNSLSRYNFGMGIGMLGGNSASGFQQAFIKFNFGISLNSEWFVRRKIN